MPVHASARALVWTFSVALAACASSGASLQVKAAVSRGAYADALQVYERQGRDRGVLRSLAQSVLLLDAQAKEQTRRHTAFTEFALLGTRARPMLDELSEAERPAAIRVQALTLLARLGDSAARSELRGMVRSGDPEVADQAFVALDPESDQALITQALREPRKGRRLAALALIARQPLLAFLPELAQTARLDPQPVVRMAALGALEACLTLQKASHGAATASSLVSDPRFSSGLAALQRALGDEVESVRIAAFEAYARVAPEQAAPTLDQQLGAAGTRESLAAAAALLRMSPARETVRASAAIAQGLSAIEPAVRGYAAVLIRTLPARMRDVALLRQRLAHEPSADVKLGLALALGSDDAQAHAALVELAKGVSLPAAEAAGELASRGDATARARLLAMRTSPSSMTRIYVARALGRSHGSPGDAATLLADRDAAVRAAAAGAVLRALFET